jgi:hypothetical protein
MAVCLLQAAAVAAQQTSLSYCCDCFLREQHNRLHSVIAVTAFSGYDEVL